MSRLLPSARGTEVAFYAVHGAPLTEYELQLNEYTATREICLHWELIKVRIQFKTDILGTMFSGVSVAQSLEGNIWGIWTNARIPAITLYFMVSKLLVILFFNSRTL